jgi:hypothetical protein
VPSFSKRCQGILQSAWRKAILHVRPLHHILPIIVNLDFPKQTQMFSNLQKICAE